MWYFSRIQIISGQVLSVVFLKDTDSEWTRTKCGVPQGSLMGSPLFYK